MYIFKKFSNNNIGVKKMKKENKDKQVIKCSVHDCKHCDCECDNCKLEGICVCNCGDTANTQEGTMCSSYENKE